MRISRFTVLALPLALAACLGHTSTNNEAVGQVKRVLHATPLLCPDYSHVDLSLGVMQNDSGSMSTQDMWLYVPNKTDADELSNAQRAGKLVKLTYDIARSRWFGCVEKETVTHVEVLP